MLTRWDGPTVTLVVNPSAGRGRARQLLPKVVTELVTGMPEAHLRVHQATSFDDARLRTIRAVEAARPPSDDPEAPADSLIVMGGDGMAHLGVNACAETPVRLGVIPAGTGNDFCRGVGLPVTTGHATRAITSGRTRRVDVNSVSGNRLRDRAERRFVGSVLASGYDARVNRRTNNISMRLGSLAYGYAALTELARFEPLRYRLTIDGHVRHEPAMLVAIGNAGVFGGGMRICPDADVTDGLLDITVVHPVSRVTLLRLLPKMYDGSFVRDPAVEMLKAREVTVDGNDMFVMADGEELGDVPVTARVVPQALTIHVP